MITITLIIAIVAALVGLVSSYFVITEQPGRMEVPSLSFQIWSGIFVLSLLILAACILTPIPVAQ